MCVLGWVFCAAGAGNRGREGREGKGRSLADNDHGYISSPGERERERESSQGRVGEKGGKPSFWFRSLIQRPNFLAVKFGASFSFSVSTAGEAQPQSTVLFSGLRSPRKVVNGWGATWKERVRLTHRQID